MALVNQAKREINAKVVFFGPGLAGKASNLKHVYGKLKPDFRGAMKSMNVQDSRMLFFDFTPPGDGNVDGFRVRFHLYTVSGGSVDPAAWKMVLKGVDGVVFVADSAPERQAQNRESLENLVSYLKGYGQSLSSIPVVFQYNKSDLADAVAVAEMDRALNPAGYPHFKASSQNGEGVLQTLLALVKHVLTALRSKGVEGLAGPEGLQRMVETAAPAEHAPQAPAAQAAPAGEEAAPQPEPPAPETPQAPAREEGQLPPAQAEAGPERAEEPLSVEFAGAPEAAGPGLIRLPLTVRSGARGKSVVLTVAISLEEV